MPDFVPNWIGGHEQPSADGQTFSKIDPATGRALCRVARSTTQDTRTAVAEARQAQPAWAGIPVVQRGDILREFALLLRARRQDVAAIVHAETGKSLKDALAEVDAAFELGMFMAGEARRFYGKTTTSAVPNRSAQIVRVPVGVCALIVAWNTPVANVAWKVFPALLCGNTVVLKMAEDTPATGWALARLADEVGVPKGVFNVVQGLGEEAGAPLVEHPDVDLVSFTGSCEVGRWIQKAAGGRLARVCLELGGKNPFVVCDDADLDRAVHWAILSAFSNAGQRCASGSRLIVFDAVYDEFKTRLLDRVRRLRVGPSDTDDFGPVINEKQLGNMLAAVERARKEGASVLAGGQRLTDPAHSAGTFMGPTILENAAPASEISRTELFGPITILYRARDFEEALQMANDSPFGLTAAIHTRNLDRAARFAEMVQAGMVTINGGTFGNEPHTPFGGVKQSGTGWREPGSEALDAYSEWKTVFTAIDPSGV